MFNAAAYYWAGKEPATQWFTAMPFGLNPRGMYAWYNQGGGLELWEETYAAFDLIPRPAGTTGNQMGGWFKNKVGSMADLQGLKFRIPGLGGKVYAEAGTTVVLTPGGEIFPALERGVIDGSEWVGPHDDMKLGLHNAAGYYYYPGWHEPGTTGEFTFNRKAYEELPSDLKAILDYAASYCSEQMLAEYEAEKHRGAQHAAHRTPGTGRNPPLPRRHHGQSAQPGARRAGRGSHQEPNGREGARIVHQVPGRIQPLGGNHGRRLSQPRERVSGTCNRGA